MRWARILAFVTGMVDQELRARIEYLAAENNILKAQLKEHRVLHNPMKPLRIADKKVLRSEAIREVPDHGQGERAYRWISERFRSAPRTG